MSGGGAGQEPDGEENTNWAEGFMKGVLDLAASLGVESFFKPKAEPEQDDKWAKLRKAIEEGRVAIQEGWPNTWFVHEPKPDPAEQDDGGFVLRQMDLGDTDKYDFSYAQRRLQELPVKKLITARVRGRLVSFRECGICKVLVPTNPIAGLWEHHDTHEALAKDRAINAAHVEKLGGKIEWLKKQLTVAHALVRQRHALGLVDEEFYAALMPMLSSELYVEQATNNPPYISVRTGEGDDEQIQWYIRCFHCGSYLPETPETLREHHEALHRPQDAQQAAGGQDEATRAQVISYLREHVHEDVVARQVLLSHGSDEDAVWAYDATYTIAFGGAFPHANEADALAEKQQRVALFKHLIETHHITGEQRVYLAARKTTHDAMRTYHARVVQEQFGDGGYVACGWIKDPAKSALPPEVEEDIRTHLRNAVPRIDGHHITSRRSSGWMCSCGLEQTYDEPTLDDVTESLARDDGPLAKMRERFYNGPPLKINELIGLSPTPENIQKHVGAYGICYEFRGVAKGQLFESILLDPKDVTIHFESGGVSNWAGAIQLLKEIADQPTLSPRQITWARKLLGRTDPEQRESST